MNFGDYYEANAYEHNVEVAISDLTLIACIANLQEVGVEVKVTI
jgi:hypothetical protein